jgi:thymidine phosphorylase
VDARRVGRACLALGAGRKTVTDAVDPAAGLTEIVKIGAEVQAGDLLMRLHAAGETPLAAAARELEGAVAIGAGPPPAPALIAGHLFPEGAAA